MMCDDIDDIFRHDSNDDEMMIVIMMTIIQRIHIYVHVNLYRCAKNDTTQDIQHGYYMVIIIKW